MNLDHCAEQTAKNSWSQEEVNSRAMGKCLLPMLFVLFVPFLINGYGTSRAQIRNQNVKHSLKKAVDIPALLFAPSGWCTL